MTVDSDRLAVPWLPESLRDRVLQHAGSDDAPATLAELRGNWRYVLVEEVAGGIAELHSWPWPLVDQTGRLAWPEGDTDAVLVQVVPNVELQQRVYAPSLLRQARAGDTFAVRRPGQVSIESGDDPLEVVLGGELLDISPDARLAAKISYFGSSAAIFHEDPAVTDLLEEAAEQRRQRTAIPLNLVGSESRASDPGRDGNG
jgi:hypothetical protein